MEPQGDVMHILIDHHGYGQKHHKLAILQLADGENSKGREGSRPYAGASLPDSSKISYTLCDIQTGLEAFQGIAGSAQRVSGWRGRRFFELDFSSFQNEGSYHLTVTLPDGQTLVGGPVFISSTLPRGSLISDLLCYFKSMRCTGIFDKTDRSIPFFGGRADKADVHGGWFDASGDVSKYLSHLSYARFFNPQQAPLLVWSLLESKDRLTSRNPEAAEVLERKFREEACHGADFLVRMQDPEGYFYTTVFDRWSWDIEERRICAYKTQQGILLDSYRASYRSGGGMAIAALARASVLDQDEWMGEYNTERYLAAAETGFAMLEARNREFNGGDEDNILDDYCALLAASELVLATGKETYRTAAALRRKSLAARVRLDGPIPGWLDADGAGRPFCHASDAGLPVVALLRARQALGADASSDAAITAILGFELAAVQEVANPFRLARQYAAGTGESPRTRFFIPHANETGYWWQGENARLGSLAAAAFMACADMNLSSAQKKELHAYALDQLGWILGRNPFDTCMMHGAGRNTPPGEADSINMPGGIMNGITAGFHDESDIAFLPPAAADDPMHRWRWAEQWLPHASWFLAAISSV